MSKKYNSLIVRRAMQSEYADRLVEIAIEHLKLARLALEQRGCVTTDAEIIDERIALLRDEREAILELFEEEDE